MADLSLITLAQIQRNCQGAWPLSNVQAATLFGDPAAGPVCKTYKDSLPPHRPQIIHLCFPLYLTTSLRLTIPNMSPTIISSSYIASAWDESFLTRIVILGLGLFLVERLWSLVPPKDAEGDEPPYLPYTIPCWSFPLL